MVLIARLVPRPMMGHTQIRVPMFFGVVFGIFCGVVRRVVIAGVFDSQS